jgi:hypothetical protein
MEMVTFRSLLMMEEMAMMASMEETLLDNNNFVAA